MVNLFEATFLLAFLSVSRVASEESVTIIPVGFATKTIYLEDEAKVRISCSHDKGAEIFNYTWLTPLRSFGETKQAKDVDGMSIMLKEKKNTFEYILEIESFSEDYVGEYGCWPMPRYESFMMSKLTLKRMIPENITAYPDERVELSCYSGYGEIGSGYSDWYRNGEIVSRIKYPKRKIYVTYGNLVLDNPEVVDSGLYECKVLTPHGYLITAIYQLNVVRHEDPRSMSVEPKQSPGFYADVQKNRIYEGLEVKLRCFCRSCWPLTSFMWITPFGNFSASGDKQLPKNFSISKSVYGRDFVLNLTIQAAKKSHEGNYTCLLENTLGTYNDSVSFKILPDSVNVGKAVAFEGYRVKLRCNSDHMDRDPMWDRSSKFVKTHNISAYGVYTIFPVTTNDSGQYLCEYRQYTTPQYSYAPRRFTARYSASYNLRVLSLNEELPMIVNRMKEGGKIKLNCGTEENANRIWTHNSHLIQSVVTCPMTKAFVLVPVNNKTLTVEGRFSNSGVYRCNYKDSEGVVQKKKFLVLIEPRNLPKLQPDVPTHNLKNVTSDKSEVTVKRDLLLCEDFVTLGCKCVRNCQPLLNYNWTVPESCPAAEISENLTNDPDNDDGFIYSLKVPVDSNCSGMFSCHLGNSKGTTTHNFRITTIYGNSINFIGRENICCPKRKSKKLILYKHEFCGGF